MSSFWSRTKRRAVAVIAAGAASAATAYCVYTWYTSSLTEPSPPPQDQEEQATLAAATRKEQEDRNKIEEINEDNFESITPDNEEDFPSTSKSTREQRHNHHQQPPPVLIDPTGTTTTAALDAEAHLQHHFESIQQIADATTLPSLLPALSRALAASDGIDASLERLRLAKGGTLTLSPEEKLRLWTDLSGAALGRLTASIWSLSLLSLQVRVQLNVLGRHLYLEAALHDPAASSGGILGAGGGGGGIFGGGRGSSTRSRFGGVKPPPQLSAPSQESFLSFSEYLTNVGHVKLLAIARKAADAALVGVALDQEINSEELASILSRALALFTQEVLQGKMESESSSFMASGSSGHSTSPVLNLNSTATALVVGGWIEFLLPPPQELREILRVKKPDDRAMLPNAHEFLVDVDAVHAMVEEVGCILSSERFQQVALSAARDVSRLAAAGLSERLGQGIALPFARLVPLILAEAKSTLSARGEAAAVIATIPEVAALCATVYSCGPPL